jgi:hypothetical protein
LAIAARINTPQRGDEDAHMGTSVSLGRLERRPAREAWSGEATAFTPWLADNLEVLGGELGLALSLRGREHPVGRYSLDLLLEDARGRAVIVENQFGQTDHDHLGKVLTYAAGTKAQLVIWIAESFTEEHAAALGWLNDTSIPGVGFFGVELELLRIGAEHAPHFRVVVRPNEWAQEVHRAASAREEWTWDRYAAELHIQPNRIAVGRALVERLQDAVAERELPWQIQFRKGYVALQRAGAYNVAVVDVYWRQAPRFGLKLPAAPEVIGISSPYPKLQSEWDAGDSEWGFHVPDLASVPDVGVGLDVLRNYHPASGPLAAVPGA